MSNDRMYQNGILFMLAETPVHAGSGAELGAVDLPVQRERHTRYPTIHGSGVKGVLRDLGERHWSANGGPKSSECTALFGSDRPEGDALEAGSLVVSDARLLLLPVRSVGNPFAWVTCPYALARLRRDLAVAQPNGDLVCALAAKELMPPKDTALVSESYPLAAILLEEIELTAQKVKAASTLAEKLGAVFPDELDYWKKLLPKNLAVVPDDHFADLALHGTEVVTRVRLTEQKTVQEGALWTEEYLPADSLLYCVLGIEPRRLKGTWDRRDQKNGAPDGVKLVKDLIAANPVAQFGGKETVGRGFLRLIPCF